MLPAGDYWETAAGSTVKKRVHLPIRYGGMGVCSLADTCKGAYIGSLALTLAVIKERDMWGMPGAPFTVTEQQCNTALPEARQLLDSGCFIYF